MKINVFYFSGTGNTLYYVEHIMMQAKNRAEVRKFDVSKKDVDYKEPIINADIVVLAFPTVLGLYSPMMGDFVDKYENCLLDKEVCLLSVAHRLSGDSIAQLKSKLEKMGAVVRYARQLGKPNNITDVRVLRRNRSDDERLLQSELPKLNALIDDMLHGRSSVVIKLGKKSVGKLQRMYALPRIQRYRQGLKINLAECNYCLKCVEMCPSGNIFLCNHKVCAGDKCVACYRCVNACPRQAISLFSKYKPRKQFKGIEYNK